MAACGSKGKESRKGRLARGAVHLVGGPCLGGSPLEGVHIFRYDTAAFPFYRAVQALTRAVPGENALAKGEYAATAALPPLALLHEPAHWPAHQPACPQYFDGLVLNGITRPPREGLDQQGDKLAKQNKVSKKKKKLATAGFHRTAAYLEFLAVYDAFIEQVVAPLLALPPRSADLGAGDDDAGCVRRRLPHPHRAVICQRPPTLRFNLGACPGHRTAGRLHCDAEYDPDQRFELNLWLPVTPVSEAAGNTLYVESAPGRGDFAPIEMGFGQCALFWGHKCRHFTKPNVHGASRVSFDARIVSAELFAGAWGGAGATRSRDGDALGHGEWRRYDCKAHNIKSDHGHSAAAGDVDSEALRQAVLRHYEALGGLVVAS